MSTREHRAAAPASVRIAILAVSTTRSLAEDASGHWIRRQAEREGHRVVCHRVVTDDATAIVQAIAAVRQQFAPQVILTSGGTGIAPRDVTIEAVRPLLKKELTAFGVLFAQLSFEQIDAAAMLSRATAGVLGDTLVFCLPGGLKACQLACRALIWPEIGHLVAHLTEP